MAMIADSMGVKAKRIVDGMGAILASFVNRSSHSNAALNSQAGYLLMVDLYRDNGIARRVIDLPALEMTRQWIKIKGDPDSKMKDALALLGAKRKLRKAIETARLTGGAMVFMLIDDGLELNQPVGKTVRKVYSLQVYSRFEVYPGVETIDDPQSPYFGEREYYTLRNSGIKIHRSRFLRFDGLDIPNDQRDLNMGWGDPALRPVLVALNGMDSGFTSSVGIIKDFIQTTISVANLQDMLGADGGTEMVKERMEMLDHSRSVANLILLDSEEQYSKTASNVGGLSDLIDRLMIHVSAVTGIPATKLFGRAPAGLNATGEGDIKNWYDDVKGQQEDDLEPELYRLFWLIAESTQGPFAGDSYPSDLGFEFAPLWQMDDKDSVEIRLKQSQTDNVYLSAGVLTPMEVRESRFGGDDWSCDTTIDNEAYQGGYDE